MMTMIARICALCAVCTLCENMLLHEKSRQSIRMIGGLLMLQLVLSQSQELIAQVREKRELMEMFDLLLK